MDGRSSGGATGTGTEPSPIVSGRKRGHQHHVRHSGTRRSNVPVDEVIAALRAEFLPTDSVDSEDVVMQTAPGNRVALTEIPTNARTQTQSDLSDSNNNVNSNLPPLAQAQSQGDNNNNHGDEDVSICSDLSESTASNSSHSKKVKTKRDGSKRSTKKRESPSSEHRKRKPRPTDPPKGERPPLEGAADNDTNSGDPPDADIENDPEAAEWSKLRCTSERTEVVAEREYRRQNRRCADYPGLAFGRSIFSSDTMMKLNIIRNELHNIMKTQLKRVRLSSEAILELVQLV